MPTPANDVITTTHREGDDLLTAGLGGDGLRAMKAPTFADPVNPIAAELRRQEGNIARTAKELRVPKTTLNDKIRKYRLQGE